MKPRTDPFIRTRTDPFIRTPFIRTFIRIRLITLVVILCTVACRSRAPVGKGPTIQSLSLNGLENTYRYSERVYGGSGPYTATDFSELKQLGIDLVVSVDGATPKVQLAEKEGLQYVHVPIGYDGVSREAKLQLVKVYMETSGPIYVHCHHGIHRGPAAIASMLIGVDEMTPESGIAVLKQVGTSESYQGLYRAVENARMLSRTELAEAKPLVSVATVSDFIQSMAAIDVHWDHLKLIRKAGWVATAEHPDIDPAHEALLLNEQFRELIREDREPIYSGEDFPELQDFRCYLNDSVQQSAELEFGLRQGKSMKYLESQFQALEQSCVSCHEAYRN